MNHNGCVYRGWNKVSGMWHYFDPADGHAWTGWNRIGQDVYFMNHNGNVYTGWKNISGKTYYFETPTGKALRGLQVIDGKTYYFDENAEYPFLTDTPQNAGNTIDGYKYKAVYTMEATAYTHTGNPTASGAWPQAYKTVAVDRSIIPFGTKVYIPMKDLGLPSSQFQSSFGPAIAQDIGGAINGYRIDLFFDTEEECIQFGWRTVKVYVLE